MDRKGRKCYGLEVKTGRMFNLCRMMQLNRSEKVNPVVLFLINWSKDEWDTKLLFINFFFFFKYNVQLSLCAVGIIQ